MTSSPCHLIVTAESLSLHAIDKSECINAAVRDLCRDFAKVLGNAPKQTSADAALITIRIDASLAPETYRLRVHEKIEICGGDELGVIYGIYAFTEKYLGVDPLWFWKDIEPAPQSSIALPVGEFTSPKPTFRWRGWFLNDEDLLGQWKDSGHSRFLDWPKRAETMSGPAVESNYERRLLTYYTPIIALDVMEAVFEALLRLGGNLIIPASFIDIFNEPEADIIRAAIRRGLYVSQHHVEPMGVSHFAYESWWARQQAAPAFSYREDRESMLRCWTAYAKRWSEVAGEKLIWQVGLRGRGDRPLWNHDPEAQSRAGEFISGAIHDQMDIIRVVDSRPCPPATLTLWLEGAKLLKEGCLKVPDEVIYIFADHHLTQEMQEDFQQVPRTPERMRGFYYHVAVWTMGPHLVQGPSPEKISRTVQQVVAAGDTTYAILNVSNIREHLMGLTVWTRQVWTPEPLTTDTFLNSWCPEKTAPLYRQLLDAVIDCGNSWNLYDGGARTFVERLLTRAETGRPVDGPLQKFTADTKEIRAKLQSSCAALQSLINDAQQLSLPKTEQPFVTSNLVVQAILLRGLYGTIDSLLASPPDYTKAANHLQSMLNAFPQGMNGKWKDWYRGDLKVGVAALLSRVRTLRK